MRNVRVVLYSASNSCHSVAVRTQVTMSKSPAVAALLPGYSNTLFDPESKELKYCDKLKLVIGTDLMKFL